MPTFAATRRQSPASAPRKGALRLTGRALAALLTVASWTAFAPAAASAAPPTIAPGSYSSTQIYHSPYVSTPTRGFTNFTGSWIDPRNQNLVVAFGQATGPIPATPTRDFTTLTNTTEYLTSSNAGSTFTKWRSDPLVSTTGKGIASLAASAQATIGLKDGTLIRRVNGEDICDIEPTVKCTAYIQRLAPATSANPNPTWSSPKYLLDPYKSTYQLSRISYLRDGRLVATGQEWLVPAGQRTASSPVHALLMVSDDQGLTWTNALTYFSSESYMFPNEWDVAELSNGDLLAVFRSRTLTAPGATPTTNTTQVRNQALLRANRDARGAIAGYTMTDVKAAPFEHSGHPELLSTQEGVVLHITSSAADGRSVIHYTADRGASWTLLSNSASRRGIYYPTSFQAADGTIYVFGHVGADDDYGERDQSITMDKFRLTTSDTTAPPPPPPPPPPVSDTVAPAVTVTTPTASATVSGTSVSLSAEATDSVGVVGVRFRVDGSAVESEDTTRPFTVSWNSTTVANGSHSITAVARDGAGNLSTSGAVTVNVQNAVVAAPPPATGYSSRIQQTTGLLSYWRLGEPAGSSTAVDAKGGRNGSYQNDPAMGMLGALSGDSNTAITLDGVNDNVSLPSMPSSVDFTVEGWQKLDATAATNNTLYGGAGTLRLMPRPGGFYAGVTLGGLEYAVQGTTASNTGQWVHWALVRSAGQLTVYRNGVSVGIRTGLPAATSASLSGGIGRQATVNPTKGAVDEVALYGSALSASELAAHYAAR